MELPELSEPNPAELDWVAGRVAHAAELIGGEAGTCPDVDQLDALWAAWLESGSPEEANDMVHVIGLSFGQRLVDDLGMRWVVASDTYGTEIAVHHGSAGNALVYPANLVAKRWESRETGFLRPIYDEVAAKLAELGA